MLVKKSRCTKFELEKDASKLVTSHIHCLNNHAKDISLKNCGTKFCTDPPTIPPE